MDIVAERRIRLDLEQLDRRDVPAASVSYPLNGVLTITGDRTDDQVWVTYDQTRLDPLSTAKIRVTTSWGDDFTFDTASVQEIHYYGMAGDDWFANSTAIPCRAHGGPGNDTLITGSGDDYLYGDDGDDSLVAGAGGDHLYGNDGTDVLYGMEGDDYLVGGDDAFVDSMWGGAGGDIFIGADLLESHDYGGYDGNPGDKAMDHKFGEDVLA